MGAEHVIATSGGALGDVAPPLRPNGAPHPDLPGSSGSAGSTGGLGFGKFGARLFNLARRDGGETPGARVLCVASGKGGTGKSILSSNLAVLRARAGERVLLVDFDAGLANAHLLLGLAPQYDLSHVLQGQVRAEDALVPGPAGLRLLSGGVGRHILANPTRRELDRLFKALRPLEDHFDLIVIDHGAGVSSATVTHLAAANTLLLVTTHEVTALSDGYALYKRAHLANAELRVGLVVNRAPDETRALSAWERFQSASQRFLGHAPELVGCVPYDPAVLRSVELRVPVALLEPESPAARAIDGVARWPALEHVKGAKAFFDRARAALR
jgi:flagellar biosynthesis protein FlhG